MFGFTRYNYDRFRREMQQGHPSDRWFRAPEPGDEAPGFALKSLAGETVKLADFKGSATSSSPSARPPARRRRPPSAACARWPPSSPAPRLSSSFSTSARRIPEPTFPRTTPCDDKRRAAQLLREQEQIEFPILIDELGGEVHRKYGALPNAAFLIDKSGRIAYRSLASHGPSLGAALEELLERQKEDGLDHVIVHGGEDAIAPPLKTFLNAYRAIERGGYDAVMNFRGELGIPGRVVLRGGRMAKPIAEHPAISITTAVGILGAIGLGYWAGHELRKRHFANRPYNAYRKFEKRRDDDEYTAVGI